MSGEAGTTAPDLAGCTQEPIHLPGAVQPYGFLLVLDEGLTVRQASANSADGLGLPMEAILDAPLGRLLNASTAALVREAVSSIDLDARPHYLGNLPVAHRRGDLNLHRHDGVLILECEPSCEEASAFDPVYRSMRDFLASLQTARTVEELCALSVREIRRITGFGRVLAYRFDADGHGQVVAEEIEEGGPDAYDAYMGLHFPAGDIPAQARDLYRINPIRLIADAHYQPAPLVPARNPVTGRSTDLTHAALRSVSPVHLEYMRNMGTAASMSVSIIIKGRLWGLISCHHAHPRHVPFRLRAACEHIGRILSLQLETMEEHAEVDYRLELRRRLVDLLAMMAEHDSFAEGLAQSPRELLRFADATGAAVLAGDQIWRVGDAPEDDRILALGRWLAHTLPNEEVFHTDNLPACYPEWSDLTEYACGVMAVSISQIHRNYLFWFRPERVQTVNWAGNPHKPADPAARLHPRKSFALWQETVRGRSLPWRASQVESAAELRSAVLKIVLRQAEEMAGLAEELGRVNKELEAFSYSVSHDLRAPLRHIVGFADLIREYEGDNLSDRGKRFIQNIIESAGFAGTLIDDLLTFSQMGRASLRPARFDLTETFHTAVEDFAHETRGRSIEWRVDPLPEVVADPAFLRMVARNLVSNAIKYTRTREEAVVEIGSIDTAEEHVIFVRDNGVGFNMKYVGKLFGVFQRLHRMEDFEGNGIGLANVRRIIERHEGRVWAEGELEQGATFYFALPKNFLRHTETSE